MDTINAGLFPISFNAHVIFTIVSVLFFIFQYTRQRHLYQLLSAIAIPLPLILYVDSSQVVFDVLGVVELVMVVVIGAMLFSVGKREDKEPKGGASATEATTTEGEVKHDGQA